MIIIIHYQSLSQRGKDDGDYDSPTSQDETPEKDKKERKKEKSEAKKSPTKKEKEKMREKERRGNVTILLPHLCFRVAPCFSCRESPMQSLSYTSGNFSLQNLYIPMMGFLKCLRSS